MDGQDFVECETCRAKPGSPVLCAGCLSNRKLIGELQAKIKELGEKRPGRLKGDLTAYWSTKNTELDLKTGRRGDVMFSSTDGPHAVDGRRLLYHAFSIVKMGSNPDDKSFLDELEARGFDLATIRFSIDRKK